MRIMSAVLIALILSISAFAQFKAVKEKEYNAALEKARTKTEKVPKRIKTISKEYSDAKLLNTTSVIEEYLSDDKGRRVETIEEGNTKTVSERISIGKSLFERNNGGDWKKTKDNGSRKELVQNIMTNGVETHPATCHEYLVTPYQLDGKPVTFYYSLEVLEENGKLTYIENKDWVNSEGMIVLSDLTESNIVLTNVFRFETVTYEYNPVDLKIEAPMK